MFLFVIHGIAVMIGVLHIVVITVFGIIREAGSSEFVFDSLVC